MSCFYCDEKGWCTANCGAAVHVHQCKSSECKKNFLSQKPRSSCVFCGNEAESEQVSAMDVEMYLTTKKDTAH